MASLVRIEKYSGHVYNLETEDGYYVTDGLYTKNSHRAMHAGQYAVDEQHGVEKIEWLASSDACDVCRKLNGQQRKLGVPFLVKTTGPEQYRKVFYPGAHPGCMCSYKSIMNLDRVTPRVVESLKSEARIIA